MQSRGLLLVTAAQLDVPVSLELSSPTLVLILSAFIHNDIVTFQFSILGIFHNQELIAQGCFQHLWRLLQQPPNDQFPHSQPCARGQRGKEPTHSLYSSSIILASLKGVILKIVDFTKYCERSRWDGIVWMVTFLSTVLIDVDIGLIVKIIASVMVVMVNVFKASRKGKGSRKYQDRIYFETLMLLIRVIQDMI